MSDDLARKLRRQADDFDRAADGTQGTLAAYWRGSAHGLRTAAREISQAHVYQDLATMIRPSKCNGCYEGQGLTGGPGEQRRTCPVHGEAAEAQT